MHLCCCYDVTDGCQMVLIMREMLAPHFKRHEDITAVIEFRNALSGTEADSDLVDTQTPERTRQLHEAVAVLQVRVLLSLSSFALGSRVDCVSPTECGVDVRTSLQAGHN